MLVWLDGANSIKGKPNENYARELFELFSLGVGNYSETDIQEAARRSPDGSSTATALCLQRSGMTTARRRSSGKPAAGATAMSCGLCLEQPAAGRFLARALFRQFVSEDAVPPDALIEPLAEQLRQSDYDIANCVRTILRSNQFNSDHAWRARVKGPVEYVIALLRKLDASVPVEDLATSMDGVGQSLFAPPNVKGWEGGRAWLNSATLVSRHNLAWRLVGGQDPKFSSRVDLARIIEEAGRERTGDARRIPGKPAARR